jgi:hypothetical protein
MLRERLKMLAPSARSSGESVDKVTALIGTKRRPKPAPKAVHAARRTRTSHQSSNPRFAPAGFARAARNYASGLAGARLVRPFRTDHTRLWGTCSLSYHQWCKRAAFGA